LHACRGDSRGRGRKLIHKELSLSEKQKLKFLYSGKKAIRREGPGNDEDIPQARVGDRFKAMTAAKRTGIGESLFSETWEKEKDTR